jgi:hypothetical protein
MMFRRNAISLTYIILTAKWFRKKNLDIILLQVLPLPLKFGLHIFFIRVLRKVNCVSRV